jgi:hypothetical protein
MVFSVEVEVPAGELIVMSREAFDNMVVVCIDTGFVMTFCHLGLDLSKLVFF